MTALIATDIKNPTKPIIAVWFSCGAASAVAAYKTKQKYGHTHDIRIINNPVAEEDNDNLRFMHDVSIWLGMPIECAYNSKFPNASAVEVWDKKTYMAGIEGAPCTQLLKKQARYAWEIKFKPDWHVLGFTTDEQDRHDRFVLTERDNVLPVLIEAGISKRMCFDILKDAGIRRPRIYDMGYPNANCIGCVKATSPTYWNHVRHAHPEVFQARADQSRRIGAKLVRHKGKRIYLDELPPDAKGRPMKTLQFECGIFCEEDKP